MPTRRTQALLFSLLVCMLASAAPAFAGDETMTANDDNMRARPTGVVDVLANDTSSSPTFTVVSNTQPSNGQVTCSELGACFYKAAAGFTGNDSFTYTASSAGGAQDTATVNVGVSSSTAAAALIARDDDVATKFNTAKTFNALANDTGDGIQMVDNGQPKHGTATCEGNGKCTYTPEQGYSGSDGFVYTIQESGGGKARAALGSVGGSGRRASAAVHILVAPSGTDYRLSATGSPVNPSGGAIPSGGKANWALGVFAIPDGVSGQELAAIGAPEGTGTLTGPHSVTAGSLKMAKGWSGSSGDKTVSYKAGDGALLGNSSTQTFPKPLPPISQGTGGDGHVPILVGTKVFAFFHHSNPTSATCVDRATGDVCPGYPKTLDNLGSAGFNSTDNNGPGVVEGSKMWVHLLVPSSQSASIGLFCWDESTDSTCGYTIVDRGTSQGTANASAPIRSSDGNAWFTADTGKAYCVNPATGATCGSIDNPLPKTFSSYDSVGHGSKVWFSRESGGQVTCIDTATRALCSGWTDAQTFGGAWNLVNRHAATGEANGICAFLGQNGSCMADDNPAAATAVNNFVHFEPHYSGSQEAEFGTRTLVGSLDRTGVGCYDWSVPAGTNPGSPCTGGDYGTAGAPPGWLNHNSDGSALPQRGAYGVASDGSCAIALGDRGQVYTTDPAGSAPCVSLGSGTDRTTIDLRDQRCDGTVGTASWRNVVLSDTDDSEMDSVVVTVRDAATGEVLKSGEMIGGAQTLDLSSINAAQHPAISIDATARSKSGNTAWSDGIPPRLRTNWKSDPQTACLQTTADNACAPAPATVTVAGVLANGSGSEAKLALLRSACAAAAVQGAQASQRRCAGKRLFRIHLRFKGKDARKVTVTVRGKKQKQIRMKPRPVFRVDLRKYARQRVVVKITIITKAGKKLTGTRVYHPCTKKRPGRGFKY